MTVNSIFSHMRCSSPLYIAIIRFGYSGVPVVPLWALLALCDNFFILIFYINCAIIKHFIADGKFCFK